MSEKLAISMMQSPGDCICLTAAIRDLHLAHPGRYATMMKTVAPDIWKFNPHVTTFSPYEPGVRLIKAEYPKIHVSNDTPIHFVNAYHYFFSDTLGVPIPITTFKGDIHLGKEEMEWKSQVEEIIGVNVPFWIINAGIKSDFTAKRWVPGRWQEVVDAFRGSILFVQTGESGHIHPPLRGVIDLRGKTTTRQLIRLFYHAAGVCCHVSLPMHLAAAVPSKYKMPKRRPCVVVAGGREPAHWERYPGHRFMETIGALPCCDGSGCWKSRIVPLPPLHDEKNKHLCVNISNGVQRCMELVTVDSVVQAIKMYFDGGVCHRIDSDAFREWLTK